MGRYLNKIYINYIIIKSIVKMKYKKELKGSKI